MNNKTTPIMLALVFILSATFALSMVSASSAFTMSYNYPTEGALLNTDHFTASISASETLDSMDINLDGGAYYHACNNCAGFTVPVDRLQDGAHTLNLVGTSGSTTKELLLHFTTDTTAPTVPTVSPAVGATGVAANTNVVATFSENIQTSTVTSSSFTLRDSNGNLVAGAVSASGNTATFNPTNDLQAGETYTATLTSDITDPAGNHITQGSWTFTVAGTSSSGSGSNSTNTTTTTSGPYNGYSLVFTNPTEGSTVYADHFTATVAANETIDEMDINLDGGSYIVGCTNCNGFSVPVDRLADGHHTLDVIGKWGSLQQDTLLHFVIDSTGSPTNNTNTTTTDTVAPGTVTDLFASSTGTSSIGWRWTNPTDADFQSAIVYLNGQNVVNTSDTAYSATSLQSNTTYNITIYTVDNSGNVNTNGMSLLTATLTAQNSGNSTNETQNNQTAAVIDGYLIQSPIQGAVYNDSLPLLIDLGSATNVNYSIDGGQLGVYSVPVQIDLAAGSHSITILASSDTAYNTTTRTFTIVNSSAVSNETAGNDTNSTENNSNSTENNSSDEMAMFTIHSPVNGSTYNDSVTLNITRCNMTEVNYSVDNGNFTDYTGVTVIPLSEGMHLITVRASAVDSDVNFEETIYFTIVNSTNETQNNQTVQQPPVTTSGGSSGGSHHHGGGSSVNTNVNNNVNTVIVTDDGLNATAAQNSTNSTDTNATVSGAGSEAGSSDSSQVAGTGITGNAVANGNVNTNVNTNVNNIFVRMLSAIQTLFKNLFGDIGGIFHH